MSTITDLNALPTGHPNRFPRHWSIDADYKMLDTRGGVGVATLKEWVRLSLAKKVEQGGIHPSHLVVVNTTQYGENETTYSYYGFVVWSDVNVLAFINRLNPRFLPACEPGYESSLHPTIMGCYSFMFDVWKDLEEGPSITF